MLHQHACIHILLLKVHDLLVKNWKTSSDWLLRLGNFYFTSFKQKQSSTTITPPIKPSKFSTKGLWLKLWVRYEHISMSSRRFFFLVNVCKLLYHLSIAIRGHTAPVTAVITAVRSCCTVRITVTWIQISQTWSTSYVQGKSRASFWNENDMTQIINCNIPQILTKLV